MGQKSGLLKSWNVLAQFLSSGVVGEVACTNQVVTDIKLQTEAAQNEYDSEVTVFLIGLFDIMERITH